MPEQAQKPNLLSAIGQHAESLGGGVVGGLGSLLGALGLPGVQKRVETWGQDPSRRRLVGGGTAALGTMLTALAVRKLLSGGRQQPEYNPMFVEASFSPYLVGLRVGLIKRGYPKAMGEPVKPLRTGKSKTATPRRWGIHGSHRQRTYDRLKQKSLSSASALGR